MNRRDFLNSASAAAILASTSVTRAAVSSPWPIRLGVIGAGSRGQEDMRQFLHVPGVSIAAVCDVYPPRREQVNRIVGKDVPFVRTPHELLSRNDIDAVLVASPIACHAEHVIAAANSGRHIFGEKALGFTVEDNQQIVEAVMRNKVHFQIGHEYRYAPWVREAIRRVHAGDIGTPTHVYAYWHRNNNWRRPVSSPDPGNKLEHLINWRLYRESSGGLGTELGSHHIDMANWVFEEQPEAVLGTQSICRYHDGRTVGDNVQLIFHYSQGRRLIFSSITDNAKTGCSFWIYGTAGSIEITITDATIYYEKGNAKALAARKAEGRTIVENGIVTGASYSASGEMPYRGQGEKIKAGEGLNPTLESVRSFAGALRGENEVFADVHTGFRSAIASAVAHEAVFNETKMPIPASEFSGPAS